MHSIVHSFESAYDVLHSFILSFIYSPTQLYTQSSNHSLMLSLIHAFTHPPTHPFIHSFVHSFIRSFVHSFIHSFTQCCLTAHQGKIDCGNMHMPEPTTIMQSATTAMSASDSQRTSPRKFILLRPFKVGFLLVTRRVMQGMNTVIKTQLPHPSAAKIITSSCDVRLKGLSLEGEPMTSMMKSPSTIAKKQAPAGKICMQQKKSFTPVGVPGCKPGATLVLETRVAACNNRFDRYSMGVK